ncbi:MAG: CDP-alcohol phosphatidyltransferase family protein [Parachlamydiales bacterium]|nr:CDP-alcohol phosphatidyltransferase family protein [Parachlamydiales bacterium]
MITFSNLLSFVRVPLAFLFLSQNVYLRLSAILLAMFTDSIDGYFARKYKSASKFGAFLDPAMDKLFVYFVLGVFLYESSLQPWQAAAIITRDFSILIFGSYLAISKKLKSYQVKSIKWGKITTALQFCLLIGLTFKLHFSWYTYGLFIGLGVLAFVELLQGTYTKTTT